MTFVLVADDVDEALIDDEGSIAKRRRNTLKGSFTSIRLAMRMGGPYAPPPRGARR
jgi:hypothetical protein